MIKILFFISVSRMATLDGFFQFDEARLQVCENLIRRTELGDVGY